MTPLTETFNQLGQQARQAAHCLSALSSDEKNAILKRMAEALRNHAPAILEANAKDLEQAQANGISTAMIDRLKLDADRVEEMAAGVDHVASLPDPVGQVLDAWERPNGIKIEQVRVPIGTIAIIYESRPNVTADAAALCFKTGNATILRGGSEAFHSNQAIEKALADAGAPAHSIQLVPTTEREGVKLLAQMDQWLDLIIPRGGRGLIEAVVSNARMPVIKHYDGICHAYVDAAADLDMACRIVVDSKTQKCGVCNALETLLVHQDVAAEFLPMVAKSLEEKGVELRGCEQTRGYLPTISPATDEDWTTEYLALILAIKVVGSQAEAVEHINRFGSHHSEVIITKDHDAAEQFLRAVDSACAFHNASTRFADGSEFGFGAEIGISTDKLHARGPMGLRELTSYQYRIRGTGQTKA